MGLGPMFRLGGALPLALACLVPAASGAAAKQAESRQEQVQSTEDRRLAQIFADDAAREDRSDPLNALYRGEPVPANALSQLFTEELNHQRLVAARQALRALHGVDRERLNPQNRLSYDVFKWKKQQQLEWAQPEIRALTGVRPFNHFGGLHVEFPSLMSRTGVISFDEVSDYRRALELNAAFATLLDNAILRFREGMASGVTESKLTVRNMIGQLDAMLAQPVEQSPFYSPVIEFPPGVSVPAREQLRADFSDVIRNRIRPAYQRLRVFLSQEYLPRAREDVGLHAMEGGDFLYSRLIERETTLKLEPEDVHQLGLSEVARIQREMDAVRQELGFSGSLHEFFAHIRDDPRYHPKNAAELQQGFKAIERQVKTQIPRFFAQVPETSLTIKPYPAYREKYEPGASYQQGGPDGSRPGIFYFNTYDLPSRYLTSMATLYLHEGAPGHHFQISLAQEDEALPDFQRFGGNNAFIEGWALYAETLGYEMGIYDDPMQHWGTLDDEMLRAMRLVVDTGLHAKGWSRERAIDYMLANSGMGRTDATAEVERYIANPAQALSYKIGALTIQRLRHEAEEALGSRFDIRAFHEQLLSSGALPLPVLETKIDSWIESVR